MPSKYGTWKTRGRFAYRKDAENGLAATLKLFPHRKGKYRVIKVGQQYHIQVKTSR